MAEPVPVFHRMVFVAWASAGFSPCAPRIGHSNNLNTKGRYRSLKRFTQRREDLHGLKSMLRIFVRRMERNRLVRQSSPIVARSLVDHFPSGVKNADSLLFGLNAELNVPATVDWIQANSHLVRLKRRRVPREYHDASPSIRPPGSPSCRSWQSGERTGIASLYNHSRPLTSRGSRCRRTCPGHRTQSHALSCGEGL